MKLNCYLQSRLWRHNEIHRYIYLKDTSGCRKPAIVILIRISDISLQALIIMEAGRNTLAYLHCLLLH